MMLDHLGEPAAAAAILGAVETVLARGGDTLITRHGRHLHHRDTRQSRRRRRHHNMKHGSPVPNLLPDNTGGTTTNSGR